MKIADREIGPEHPVFLQAEVGVTHNGQIQWAIRLVEAAAQAGLDAVKFIVTDPEKIGAVEAPFRYETVDGPQMAPIGGLLKQTMLKASEWREITRACQDHGIIFYATVDHLEGVDLLESLEVPAYKLSAWDIAYLPLIRRMSQTGKPILMDVGTATQEEWRTAATSCRWGQTLPLLAPHPHGARDWNFSRHHVLPWGFSSPGRETWCDFLALGRGAWVIEKRLTLDRSEREGHHHWIALEPQEMREWVRQIRTAEASLLEGAWQGSLEAWAERSRWDRDEHGLRHG